MTRTGGAPGADGRGVAGALGLGWLMVSTSAVVIVLAAPVPPLVVAAGRVAVTALLWCAIAALRSAPAPLHASGHVPHGRIVLSGVLLGAHFAAWIASLSLTSVAHGAVLVALQPLFAGLFGLMLGDRPPLVRLALGVAVAGGGTLLMATAGEATEGTSFVGDALAVLAGALSALYLTINRGIGGALPLGSLLARVNGVAALFIALLVPVFGGGWWHPAAEPLTHGAAIVWLGLGPGLVGHGLMNWAARRVPVHVVSLVVLLEPIGAALLAWFVLGQRFGAREALGAALLLAGAGLASARGRSSPGADGPTGEPADPGAG